MDFSLCFSQRLIEPICPSAPGLFSVAMTTGLLVHRVSSPMRPPIVNAPTCE